MMTEKTKQIFISNLLYPYDSVHTLLFDSESAMKIFTNSEYQVKLFIGSDWSIQNSGFSFFGPNGLNTVFELKNIIKNDFMRQNTYSITQINGNQLNIDLEAQFSLIKNTCNNSCVIELRINHHSDEDINIFEKYIKISYLKEIIKKIFVKIKNLFSQPSTEEKIPKIILNQSFFIKKNYKEAFNFFYNWDNIAKSLKTDKIWKILKEEGNKKDKRNYKNYSIVINDDIKIYYRVMSIKEVKDEKIEIVFNKSGKNSFPALNSYIKLTFFNMDKNLSLFLYETHLPFNIASSIYQTVSYYLFYCNYQSKAFGNL